MNATVSFPARVLRRLPAFCFLVALGVVGAAAFAQPPGNGVVAGAVLSDVTRTALHGAEVEVSGTRLSTQTDRYGQFMLREVPAGTQRLRITYTGLDEQEITVDVRPGETTRVSIALSTQIYTLTEFAVTGEREGNAAAVTAQRMANNVKNVVALDSFGNLPNLNAGELAIRLPGITGNIDDEGNVGAVRVRGLSQLLTRVTVDGGLVANSGGLSRSFQVHSITGAMFEELEVIKGHTPDTGADSLGGTVNLKTRSPLNMTEKRRFSYNVGARWAPRFFDHPPLRREHPIHQLLNFSYQEVFSVLGQERNLGVAVNVFNSENVNSMYRTQRDFENTTGSPAYLWDYRMQDSYNNRKQASASVKVEYRLAGHTKFSLNTIYNDAFEPFHRFYTLRAFTSQTVGTSGNAGILPGYTDRVTQVRAAPGSRVELGENMNNFLNRTRALDFGGEHRLGRLQVDYNAGYSQAHINQGEAGGGDMTFSLAGVGWILDRTHSDLYPQFVQTAGPSLFDLSNYTPGPLSARKNERNAEITDFRLNVRYELPTASPVAIKAGAQQRKQETWEVGGDRRWNYIGTSPLPPDPSIRTWGGDRTGLSFPYFETASFIRGYDPVDPTLWREDLYFGAASRFTGTRGGTEDVTAGYLMGQGRFDRLGWLGGVRLERTEIETFGWVRARVQSTAAQRAADPVGSASRDNEERRPRGSYTKSFPSVHLRYDVSKNLKARLSWSTSFGRPRFTDLLPNETVNDTAQTVTTGNPGLRPQTAKNWDATVEYYFEPTGLVSLGWFHKTIKDYLISGGDAGTVGSGPNNGFNGQYSGYTLLAPANGGNAVVSGWEASYQQQFTFLPGPLKGLGASANVTYLRAHGDFGEGYLTTYEVEDLVPLAANASVSYQWRRFGARVLVNHNGRSLMNGSANPARRQYLFSRTIVNVGFSYQLRPAVTLFCDLMNPFNEPQESYRYVDTQKSIMILNRGTISFGVSGRF